MQNNVNNFEISEGINSQDLISIYNDFATGFTTNLFSSGIIKEIDEKQVKTYLSNPEKYQKELENLGMYYYISNPDIFQLLNTVKILPTFNYKIQSEDNSKQYDKNFKKCNSALSSVKHKELTKDLLMQLITSGTLVGIWLNSNSDVYFYTFDDLETVFPAYRKNGDWVAWIDLSRLDKMSDINRSVFCKSLHPYLTIDMYEKYKKSRLEDDKFIELPQERTCILRTNTLKRNQRLGIPWFTQAIYAISHKKKLKDLEKSVSNRIINSIFTLRFGDKDNPDYNLNKKAKKSVLNGVKSGLSTEATSGSSVVAYPNWANLEVLDIKNGDTALGEKKFESTNQDISVGTGISSALFTGDGGNFAISKINLELIYKRIGVELASIQQEVYDKLFDIILPKNVSGKYHMIYDCNVPLTKKEKIDILNKLHTQEGFSLKAIIDEIDGVDFDEFVEQSIYELEEMELQKKIQPYQSAYTQNANDGEYTGRPNIEDEDLENESTIRNKENLGNEQ